MSDRITQADSDGTSERGKAAYQERLRTLERLGIRRREPSYWDELTAAQPSAETLAYEKETTRLVGLTTSNGRAAAFETARRKDELNSGNDCGDDDRLEPGEREIQMVRENR